VPADQKWATRTIVADILTSAVRGLDLRYPAVTPQIRKQLATAKRQLEAE